MDTNLLLLAAHVREIAAEHRKKAAAIAFKSGGRMGDETFDQFQARFASAHPLVEYAASAKAELQDIARAIA